MSRNTKGWRLDLTRYKSNMRKFNQSKAKRRELAEFKQQKRLARKLLQGVAG